MLEIVALIYLIPRIRKIVQAKGLKPGKYIFTLLLLWISLELLGMSFGIKLFHNQWAGLAGAVIGAAIGGYLGYYLAINADAEKDEV